MATTNVSVPDTQVSQETELFKQTYSISIPKTMDGVMKVFAKEDGTLDEKALLYTLRTGIKQTLGNRLRKEATTRDEQGNPTFEVVDGIYDATSLLLKEPQRKLVSQRDKIAKSIANLPAVAQASILAAFDANVGAPEANTGDVNVETYDFAVALSKDGKLIMRQPRNDEDDE